MHGRHPSSEGYSMVYCKSSIREFRKLRNPARHNWGTLGAHLGNTWGTPGAQI